MKYRIWVVTIGEPLPTDPDEQRLLRAGVLARMLAEQGHDVTWWTSNFDHQKKQRRYPGAIDRDIAAGLRMVLLDGRPYRTNISVARVRNHQEVAAAFARRAAGEAKPHVIIASFPPPELAQAVSTFGRDHGVPTVLDIRDLWPDVIRDMAPSLMRWLVDIPLTPMRRAAIRACRDATAIIGLTEGYRDWGLALAGRSAGTLDRIFPLAYVPQAPPQSNLEAAEAYWNSQGVGSQPDEFIAAFFGIIGVHFEIGPVIGAARLLQDRGVPIRFILCGHGDLLQRLQSETSTLKNVLLPGWMNAAQIWTLMRKAKVGVAPYVDSDNYRKNVPNKIVEYLSANLPIVTSLEGAVRTLLTDNDCGYFYRHESADGLATAMMEAFNDRDRLAQRSMNARALFERSFRLT